MHYIKFLRPPLVEQGRVSSSLKIVLAITTDLGDSFLSPRKPVKLAVIGAYTERRDGCNQLIPIDLAHGSALTEWKSGMRVLKFEVPLPQQPVETIQIRPANRELTALSTADILEGKQGLIMAAYADISRSSDAAPAEASACFRSLRLPTGQGGANQTVQVEEDLGESIARHIWDGGVAAVSLIAEICSGSTSQSRTPALPLLHSILRPQHRKPLNILELGCGIGTLGIGMARILSMCPDGPRTTILMTDLPEAEERARANIARQAERLTEAPTALALDFEPLDWDDGKRGELGEKARSRAWDLVVLCDCTYNTDTLQPLVKTLSAVYSHSAQRELQSPHAGGPSKTKVLLATKPRHSSEKIVFDLMAADGWAVREQAVLPLPVLDGEAQSVEVYLFEMME